MAKKKEPEEPKKEKKTKKAKEEKPKKKRHLWRWVLGFIILFIIAFIPYYYTAYPVSCTKCHSMDDYYTSWKKSLHGEDEIVCSECHVRPGYFAFFTYRIGFYREIFASALDLKLSPWGATAPGESSCTRDGCHSFNRLTSRTGELKIDHKKHSKRVKCRTCHAGIVHPNVRGIGLNTPPRKQCFVCHQKEIKKCDFCHMTKYKPGTKPKTPHQ